MEKGVEKTWLEILRFQFRWGEKSRFLVGESFGFRGILMGGWFGCVRGEKWKVLESKNGGGMWLAGSTLSRLRSFYNLRCGQAKGRRSEPLMRNGLRIQ